MSKPRSKSPMLPKKEKVSQKRSHSLKGKKPELMLNTDDRICSQVIAQMTIEDENESIEFVKFIDDNDPRMLFLMTYNKQVNSTYMKVVKIQPRGSAIDGLNQS